MQSMVPSRFNTKSSTIHIIQNNKINSNAKQENKLSWIWYKLKLKEWWYLHKQKQITVKTILAPERRTFTFTN